MKGEERNCIYGFSETTKSKEGHLEDLCIDGRVILEMILMKSLGRVLPGLVWLRIRKMGRCCGPGNEPSCCTK